MALSAPTLVVRLAPRAISLLIAATNIAPAHAQTLFDGQWSVRIAATRAACGDGTMLTLNVADGRIAADSGMAASGHVSAQGAVRVVLNDGARRASGLGQLSAQSGSGTWRGPLCSGTWTAQRL